MLNLFATIRKKYGTITSEKRLAEGQRKLVSTFVLNNISIDLIYSDEIDVGI